MAIVCVSDPVTLPDGMILGSVRTWRMEGGGNKPNSGKWDSDGGMLILNRLYAIKGHEVATVAGIEVPSGRRRRLLRSSRAEWALITILQGTKRSPVLRVLSQIVESHHAHMRKAERKRPPQKRRVR